jgi:predicted Zn-dependent protease with MMP-like domain
MTKSDDIGFRLVDAIYDALDGGDPAAALQLARRTLDAAEEADPVVSFLAGVAQLELARPREAADDLRAAVAADPGDAEFRATLALALFRSCRFEEAEIESRAALSGEERVAEACWVSALLAERDDDFTTADRLFHEAAAQDPERFPKPVRMSREAFEGEVARAMERLPERYRRHLDQVAVTVEALPSEAVLLDEDEPFDPEQLLGLFVGISRDQESTFSPGGELPPRILIFQRNLERMALQADELAEEIAITVYHELGHYLGLDEDELERIDLA